MVNLELYRIFKVVADEQNITRASEILNISQPAVTKHIHNLEHELQITLFKRTKYGMELTEDGKKLYEQIKNTLNTLISAENNLKESTSITLGVNVNLPSNISRSIINKIKKYNPNLEINIVKSYTEHVFDELEKQKIDAYLSKKQPSNLHDDTIEFIKLGTLTDEFIVKSDSKLLKENFNWHDLDNKTIYTLRDISITAQNLKKILEKNNVRNYTIKNMSFDSIMDEFKNGNDVIAYITKEYIQTEIENGKLQILNINSNIEPLMLGLYYNSQNKIKNIKRLLKHCD